MKFSKQISLNTTAILLSCAYFSTYIFAAKVEADKTIQTVQSSAQKKEEPGVLSRLFGSKAKEEDKESDKNSHEENPPLNATVENKEAAVPEASHATTVATVAQPHEQAPKGVFDLSQGFSHIAENALPSVVNITTTQLVDTKSKGDLPRFPNGSSLEDLFKDFVTPGQPSDTHKRVQSLGSGFIVQVTKEDLFIVSNYHVIADAKKIAVRFHDKTEADAVVHASDERTDIAVLKVKLSALPAKHKIGKPFEWANADESHIGDWVLAIGNPFGLGNSVTSGIISSKGRDLVSAERGKGNDYVDDYIQHSAQINMGNSGGCLLNMKGQVLGINTAIFSPSGGNVGIGFAIPAGVAKKTVDQLIQYGQTKRGWLGVTIRSYDEKMAESEGLEKYQGCAIVNDLIAEGPAAKAGIKSSDIIFEYNGVRLNESNRLARLVGETEIGKTVPVKVYREKVGELALSIKVAEYEEAQKSGKFNALDKASSEKVKTLEFLGMNLRNVTNEEKQRGRKGVVIIDRSPFSSAEDAGLGPEDIIEQVNHVEVQSIEHFKKLIEEARNAKRKNALLIVYRQSHIIVALNIEEQKAETESVTNQSSNMNKSVEPKSKEKDTSKK